MEDFQLIAGMPSVIGCIGCTHIAINRPPGDQFELFRNRTGYFSMKVQAVCGPQQQFYSFVSGWYGSVHDSLIFDKSYLRQELEKNLQPGYLLGDCEYPCRRYLHTPVLNPCTPQERRYNASHCRTHSTVKRAFGLLKRRFAFLEKRLQTDLNNTKMIIVAAAVLHNIAIKQNVPMPGETNDQICNESQEDHHDGPSQVAKKTLESEQKNDVGAKERDYIIRNYF